MRVKNKKKSSAAREKNEIKFTRHDVELCVVVIFASRYTLQFFFQNKCITHIQRWCDDKVKKYIIWHVNNKVTHNDYQWKTGSTGTLRYCHAYTIL